MKANSVQFKHLMIVISAILAMSIFVGGFSIYEVDNYVTKHTEEFIDITCSNEAAKINDIFGDIEKSVKIMGSYVLSLVKSSPDIRDRGTQEKILASAGEIFIDIALNTDGALAYYLRFDPSISDNKTGLFYSQIDGGKEYVSLEPTDLSIYAKDDMEHVGWYWIPYETGGPVWLEPYYNKNNNVLMISYVIPLYHEDQFIGIVGMDFNYSILTERIHQIKVYENGFAHLELNNTVIHSGNDEHSANGAAIDYSNYLRVSQELDNGMTLVLSACYDDIWQIRYDIIYKIVITMVFLALIFSLIVFFVVKKTVRPLEKLTDASIRLSNGDYDVKIEHSNTYEIQQLSTAFEAMLLNLREHERLQHLLAYRDSLTGLRNTTSYKKWVLDFDKKVKEDGVSFGIVMLDLNFLKETNDTYGHDAGNKLIICAAQIISDTFKRSPVFRIGGDEFVVILQNRDLEEREALFEKFEAECAISFIEADEASIPVRIAKGFAEFDPATDSSFSDVFDRADDAMYKNKKNMKTIQL